MKETGYKLLDQTDLEPCKYLHNKKQNKIKQFLKIKSKVKQVNLTTVCPVGGITIQRGTIPRFFKTQ